MEKQGKIIALMPERSGVSARGKEWASQDFVLQEYDQQYPRHICFSVFGRERLDKFNLQVGADVTVAFDINAREYQGRWYNDLQAYDVRPLQTAAQPMPAQPQQQQNVQNTLFGDTADAPQENDDLPF